LIGRVARIEELTRNASRNLVGNFLENGKDMRVALRWGLRRQVIRIGEGWNWLRIASSRALDNSGLQPSGSVA
jgi:hypothetical protein